jgi:Uma2 family endonuclease
MTALTWPDHLLTLDEWDELPEDVSRRFELVDGVLQMSPSPASPHQVAATLLCAQLNAALMPQSLIAIAAVDVALVESFPPLVRTPDVVVVSLADARTGPKRYRGGQVLLAVEMVSPGSARVDRVAKMAEYAEAGIPAYWIVDTTSEPITLDGFELSGNTYRPDVAAATGEVELTAPAPVTLDLAALTA